jgi:serine/threonine-protein kinase
MKRQAAHITYADSFAAPGTTDVTRNRYRILGELGRGGMGVVYEACDTRLDRSVALKFLPDEWATDPTAHARFLTEAHAVAALEHPNICGIYDLDTTEGGRPFIVMPRYQGQTLRQRLRSVSGGASLPLPEVLAITGQIAAALEAAHEHGIVHGDVKPGNIFICRNGVVKLLDFGLAKRMALEDCFEQLSASAQHIFGTASYMAPEQILGMPLDRRTDVFSLGVVVYEMLANRLPFTGRSPVETAINVLDHRPPPIGHPSDARGEPLLKLVFRALEKLPSDRFQSARDFRRALSKCAVVQIHRSTKQAVSKSTERSVRCLHN